MIVQTCVVHVIRNSMDFASWKVRKTIASELKKIYRAKNADAGKKALDEFDASPWGKKYLRSHRVGATLGACHSAFLPFPPRFAASFHDERHRDPERQIAPRGWNPEVIFRTMKRR
jgi:hypothetical protein